LLFVALPLAVLVTFLTAVYQRGSLAVDFTHFMLPAADKVAAGGSPYPGYEYPPLVAFALVPFTFLPGANIVYTAILLACIPASLWFLGVRDWRCYGVVFVWPPVLAGLQTGNVTIPLLLGSAICWHGRDRWKIASISGGLAVAAKLLCWPLVVWLGATRRIAAAVGVLVVAVGVSLVLWSILGFSGLVGYPTRIGNIEKIVSPESYTLKVVLEDAGVGSGPARLAWGLLALAVLAGAAVFGWRRDDRRSFALVGVAMIVASPIVWLHSFLLLLLPVAVLRPRLGAAWLLPVLLVFAPGTGNGAPWETAGLLAISALTVALALLPSRRQPDGPVPSPVQPTGVVAAESR
jgi:hypothetical protein